MLRSRSGRVDDARGASFSPKAAPSLTGLFRLGTIPLYSEGIKEISFVVHEKKVLFTLIAIKDPANVLAIWKQIYSMIP